MASDFTLLEVFALSQALPQMNLPALVDPTDRELLMRRVELCIWCAYRAYGYGERGIVNMVMDASREGAYVMHDGTSTVVTRNEKK